MKRLPVRDGRLIKSLYFCNNHETYIQVFEAQILNIRPKMCAKGQHSALNFQRLARLATGHSRFTAIKILAILRQNLLCVHTNESIRD